MSKVLSPLSQRSTPLPKKRLRRRLKGVFSGAVPFVVVAIVWQIIALLRLFPNALFPEVNAIATSFWHLLLTGRLIVDTAITFYRLVYGFAIGAVLGVGCGLLMSRIKFVEGMVKPILSVMLPIPSLTYIPILIMWFGLGDTATITLVAIATFLPVALNTWTGLKSVNGLLIQAGESMGATGLILFRKVTLLAALPYIIAGLRLGLSYGWRAVVAGEMLAATTYGLGYMIFNARQFLETSDMLSGVIVIGIMGILIDRAIFDTIERKTIVKWGMVNKQQNS